MRQDIKSAALLITEKRVLPLIEELERESSEGLSVKVYVLADNKEEVFKRDKSCSGSAEIRLIIKDGIEQDSFKFSGECVVRDFSKDTGFSGFSMKGKVKHSEVSLSGRVNRYNVWEWGTKFRD